MHDWSPSPWGEAIAKNSLPSAVEIELKILRLAADAADLRRQLNPRELARAPRLAAALDACDALFEELGWGNPWNRPAEDDEAGREWGNWRRVLAFPNGAQVLDHFVIPHLPDCDCQA